MTTPWRTRPATPDDVPALTRLLDACTRTHCDRPTTEADTRARLATPGCDLATDSVVVLAGDDPIGFGYVWPDPPDDIKGFARVHPVRRGEGVGTFLATTMLARAREAGGTFTTTAWARDTAAGGVLAAAGLTPVRHFLRMVADLDDVTTGPPTGLRPYRPGDDDAAVVAAFRESFAEHWGHEAEDDATFWWDHRDSPGSGYDPTLWTVAERDGEVVAFVIATEREHGGQREGYVASIGVRPAWRGQGLAQALLRHAFAAFGARGLTRAALNVDADNVTSALRLYRSVGMRDEPAFTIWAG